MKTNRNYLLLLWGQFLGAFGDNAILMVILGPLMVQFAAGAITAREQSVENIFYTSLLFVPYVLFAPVAGFLNDRFSKTRWLLFGNAIKLAGATFCLLGAGYGHLHLLLGGHEVIGQSDLHLIPGDEVFIPSLQGMLVKGLGYFIVGLGSCFYSPAKYGILPEILPPDRLVKANGTVELLTLVAILTGSIGGSILVDHFAAGVCYSVVMAVYAGSMILNLFMDQSPACPEVRFSANLGEFWLNLRALLTHPRLSRVLVGTSLFWFCGAMIKMNFQPWGQQVLGLKDMTQISLLGLWLSIGIMIGSVAAGQLYRVGELHACRRFGFALAGAILLLGATKWLMQAGFVHVLPFDIAVLIGAGLVGGLFLIPLNAALQAESHQGKLGKTIATQNFLENTAMLGSSAFALVNVTAQFDPSQLFFGLAATAALVIFFLRIPLKLSAAGASYGPAQGKPLGTPDNQCGKP